MKRRTQFRLLVVATLAWLVWAGVAFMSDSTPLQMRVVDDQGTPIEGAVVALSGRQLGRTDAAGMVDVETTQGPVEVSAIGHVPARVPLTTGDDQTVDAVLKARVLRGRVIDATGSGVAGAIIDAGYGGGTSDGDGFFLARGAEPGTVTVDRPAWESTTFEWEGGPGETEVTINPLMIKAVHISGEAVEQRLAEFVELTETTELNALMIDLKDETGQVLYDSEVPLVKEVGADASMFALDAVIAEARSKDLYVIGRIVAFQDPVAARAAPEMSVWDEATGAPFVSRNQYFLDPTDPAARQYAIDLAKEACSHGLDEVQFDYVRFPDSRPESVQFDEGVTVEVRTSTIRSFLVEAVETLHPLGCAVGADVFGFVTTALDDGGIGQHWVDVTSVVDVASPMLYPSHYDAGWYGYDAPGDHPDGVVERALADAIARLPRTLVVRPWLQDFGYDATQVRSQIDITEEYGLGWMLWNATSDVTVGALDPD